MLLLCASTLWHIMMRRDWMEALGSSSRSVTSSLGSGPRSLSTVSVGGRGLLSPMGSPASVGGAAGTTTHGERHRRRAPHPHPRLVQELATRPVPFLTTPDLVALSVSCGTIHDWLAADHDAWGALTFLGPFPFG